MEIYFCEKCGNVMQEKDRFCPKCGAERLMDGAEMKIVLPYGGKADGGICGKAEARRICEQAEGGVCPCHGNGGRARARIDGRGACRGGRPGRRSLEGSGICCRAEVFVHFPAAEGAGLGLCKGGAYHRMDGRKQICREIPRCKAKARISHARAACQNQT